MVVHRRRGERTSWSNRGDDGFYIGPALKHYRNFTIFVPSTGGTRISNTVEFFPEHCTVPQPTPVDSLNLILQDLLNVLQEPFTHSALPSGPSKLRSAIHLLQVILRLPKGSSPS